MYVSVVAVKRSEWGGSVARRGDVCGVLAGLPSGVGAGGCIERCAGGGRRVGRMGAEPDDGGGEKGQGGQAGLRQPASRHTRPRGEPSASQFKRTPAAATGACLCLCAPPPLNSPHLAERERPHSRDGGFGTSTIHCNFVVNNKYSIHRGN